MKTSEIRDDKKKILGENIRKVLYEWFYMNEKGFI